MQCKQKIASFCRVAILLKGNISQNYLSAYIQYLSS